MELTIGQNIRTLRKSQGFTQEQLADAMGVTIGAVSKWESDLSRPDIEILVELAVFFEISVDVLLGYEWQKRSLKQMAEQIEQYCQKKQYDAGVKEAEKALQKFPNSFEINYQSARLYYMNGIEQNKKDALNKAQKLYQKSLHFLEQCTDESINEQMLYNRIAEIYVLLGDTTAAIALFKKHNHEGINNGRIGLTYAYSQKAEKALPYLSESLLMASSELFRDVIAYVNCFIQTKKIDSAISIIEWMRAIVQGLLLPGKINYANKMDIILLATLAIVKAEQNKYKEVKDILIQLRKDSLQFDTHPDFNATNIHFYYGKNRSLYDDFGKTALEGVEKAITDKQDDKLLQLWRKISSERDHK